MNLMRRTALIGKMCLITLLWVSSVYSAEPTPTATPLTVELTALRYSKAENQYLIASEMSPGDTLRYQARYTNQSGRRLLNIQAAIPVPPNTILLEPGSTEGLSASTDGNTFKPWPLVRTVRLPDGRIEIQPVPLEEIHFLRWAVPAMEPHTTKVFYTDVKVAP